MRPLLLTTVMIVFVVLYGCSGDHGSLEPQRRGSVVRAERDREAGLARAELSVEGAAKWLVVERIGDAPYRTGFAASVLDEKETELVRVAFAWPDDGSEALWFMEEAGGDRLVSHRVRAGSEVHESYWLDGEELAVDYSIPSESQIRTYEGANSSVAGDPDGQEYLEALQAVDRFTQRRRGSALYNNPSGELLMTLLSDPEVLDATLAAERPNPQLPSNRANRACLIAGTCASLKCGLGGGLLNFICTACGGMSAACTIAEWACWLAPDCN